MSRSPLGRAAAAAACALAALALTGSASGARGIQIGMYDEAQTLYGDPEVTFPLLQTLGVRVLRVNLYWDRVAPFQPAQPANPADLSYDWDVYDRTAFFAQQYGIQLVFSIFGTPGWANDFKGQVYAPRKMTQLRAFALAAARRYSGFYPAPDGRILPRVSKWLAWNEPNQPTFLLPQWVRGPNGRFVPQSARTYARMCNAIYSGVHAAGREARIDETVACGVTSPRGNNVGGGSRPSVSPLVFLRELKRARAQFDVYAHHPYPSSRLEKPADPPPARTAVTLGNIDSLVRELDRLYGREVRLWITEYGYQTNPPDRLFGVSYAQQARYLREAFALVRKHPRIDMMLWFLLRDEPDTNGWQSGLMTADGTEKPAFTAFRRAARGR